MTLTNGTQENLANGRTHNHVAFSSITKDNIESLRQLNAALFPIKYGEIFYNAVIQPELAKFCKLIYLNELPVGTICCRLIEENDEIKLYLMTMGVLADYRSQKIGFKALQHIIDAARASENPKISCMFLHVWAMNPDAKRFYERHGFQETALAIEFYKADIECRDAWVLELKLQPSEPNGEDKSEPRAQKDVSPSPEAQNGAA